MYNQSIRFLNVVNAVEFLNFFLHYKLETVYLSTIEYLFTNHNIKSVKNSPKTKLVLKST